MTTKRTAVRLLGAAMMTLAIAPWVGGGTAHAAAADDSDCGTRPDGVPAHATCVVLDENTGNDASLHGETWAWRDASNDLFVNTYPLDALSGTDPIQLCVTESEPYTADFKCLGNSADRVYAGDDTTLVIDLEALGITAAEPVYYSIHVNQGNKTTVSSGTGGTVPTTTTSAPATTATTSAPATTTVTTSAPATTTTTGAATTTAAASAATTTTSEVSVLPTKVEASESAAEETEVAVAVEGTKTGGGQLAATGSGLSVGMALAVSLGLLLGGAALLAVPGRLAVESGRHRRRH